MIRPFSEYLYEVNIITDNTADRTHLAARQWCIDRFKRNDWHVPVESYGVQVRSTFAFVREEDAILFALKWV